MGGIVPLTVSTGESIALDAYNLFVGAAFLANGHVHVVMDFRDYPHTEQIFVQTRIATDADAETENMLDRPFLLHYMAKVHLIGAVRNPQDYDDNNWGT